MNTEERAKAVVDEYKKISAFTLSGVALKWLTRHFQIALDEAVAEGKMEERDACVGCPPTEAGRFGMKMRLPVEKS